MDKRKHALDIRIEMNSDKKLGKSIEELKQDADDSVLRNIEHYDPETEKEKLDRTWLKFRKRNTLVITRLLVAQHKEKEGR